MLGLLPASAAAEVHLPEFPNPIRTNAMQRTEPTSLRTSLSFELSTISFALLASISEWTMLKTGQLSGRGQFGFC